MYLSFFNLILSCFAKCANQSSSLTNSGLCRFMSVQIPCFVDTGRSCLLTFWPFNLTLDFNPPNVPLLSWRSDLGLPDWGFSLDAAISSWICSDRLRLESSHSIGFPSKVNFPDLTRALMVSIMFALCCLGDDSGTNLCSGSVFNLFSSPGGLGDEKKEPMLNCLLMPPDEDGVLVGDFSAEPNKLCGTIGLMLSLIKLSLLFLLNLVFGLQSFMLVWLISCSSAWCVSSTCITGSSCWSSSSPPSSFSCSSSLASCSASVASMSCSPPPLTSCFFLTAAFSLACAYCWLIYPNIYIYTNTNTHIYICTYLWLYVYLSVCMYV